MPRVALIRGPYLRPDGVRPWEYLHNHTNYEVTAFESKPARFDTSNLNMPIKQLAWPEGMINAFGHQHIVSKAITKAKFPSDYLAGISNLANEFDIINTSENFNIFSLQASLSCRSAHAKLVFSTGENIPYPRSQHNPILWYIKKYVNNQADGITTTTPKGKRALIHEGVNHDKITVLPNAIDSSSFEPKYNVDPTSVDSLPDIQDKYTILFVHGLHEQKGIYDLLKSFESIREQQDVQLILIGSSKLDTEDENNIKDDSDIQWIEHVPYDFMPDLYNLADVFVLPSVTMTNNEEQFGMAALEAMSCGIPTVVTDTGGLPYVAEDGSTSIVVPERSPSKLAEAINRLLSDSELRSRLGDNGRQRAQEEFAPSLVAEILRRFYDQVLSE